ncbi:hypothetical protein [Roseixanthobacter liquoris]|uniref:hypothetical protein n=1 Tax=Roseixanthobacter liquoris TaxID=3119921 RepID=UPI003729C705
MRGREKAISAGIANTLAAGAVLLLGAQPAYAQGGVADALPVLGTKLVGLFVVATLMESALTAIFNWRLYREFFNGRAVKTLVMAAVGYAVVVTFKYDIFQQIVVLSGGTGAGDGMSRLLSALVLAGGSAAVYELFKALGLRPPVEPEAATRKPPEDKAWVSVRIVRKRAVGEVTVHFDTLADPAPELRAAPALVGVIGQGRSVWQRLSGLFFADPARVPMYGGRTVEAGATVYCISVRYRLPAEDADAAPVPVAETIYTGRFAGRSIIDFVHTA